MSTPDFPEQLFARERKRLFRVAHALTGSRRSAALCVSVARAALPRMAAEPSELQLRLTELVARAALELGSASTSGDAPEPADLEALTLALSAVQEKLRVTRRALVLLRNVVLDVPPARA